MSSLIFYNSYNIFNDSTNKDKLKSVPGGEAFSSYFQLFSKNISAIDRTGTINIPLKTEILDFLKMPEYRKYDKSFDEICDDKARELLNRLGNRKLAVMYSGGVDSTLILCSLIKNATKEELKRVVVLLSNESIGENPNFYYNYIIKNFECVSSYRFPYFLGDDNYLFVSGENADQLFGSQVNDSFTKENPYTDLFKTMNEAEGQIMDYFNIKLDASNKKYAEPMMLIFKKMVDAAPIELNNVYKFFWWINFVTKWQSVYVRILPYSMNKTTLKLEENYTTFYCSEDFQLWSMNNTDKFSEIDSAGKRIPKQYIVDVNGDKEYLNKPKFGSLAHLVKRKEFVYTMDSDMKFGKEYPTEEYYNYGNDFEKMMK
jgi:hypothetical protein